MTTVETPALRSTSLSDPIRFTLFQQVPTAILCLLMLDGGQTAKVCGYAMIGFWCGVVIISLRRRSHPSKTDIRFVRWGFLPILVVSFLLATIRTR
jgi:hypothetical protein